MSSGPVRTLLSSLQARASPSSSLLRTSTSTASDDDAEQDGPRLPPPEVTHPFPVIEQPPRCLFTSRVDPPTRFDERRRLTCTRRGAVGVTTGRGAREQFFLVPAEDDAGSHDEGEDDAAVAENDSCHAAWDGAAGEENGRSAPPRTKRRTGAKHQQRFYLKSCKFDRYLTSDASGAIRAVAPSQPDEDNSNGQTLAKPGASARWLLVRSPHGGHFVVSAAHERNLALRRGEDASLAIGLRGNNDQYESWEVEFVSGELCFLSSGEASGPDDDDDMGQRVRCDLVGQLSLTADRRGWEVWRFVEMGGGHVRIVSWMHSQFCLACDHEGRVSTVGTGKAEDRTLWTVEKAPEGYAGVMIKSVACARRVLTRNEEGLHATQEFEGEGGAWRLEAAHSQTYTLASVRHKRSVGPFPYVTENAKQSDKLVLQRLDDEGTVRVYHQAKGQYLRSNAEGEVDCSAEPPSEGDPSHLWKMAPSAEGGYTFASHLHGGRLAFNADEPHPRLCTVPSPAEDGRDAWRVDPVLPRAISSSKIKTFALGASLAVGTTVAMPFLVAGALAVVPAEATLAASVIGAGLTGAEAVASVGAIGATAAMVFRESSDALGMESEHDEEGAGDAMKRPLCGWRSW